MNNSRKDRLAADYRGMLQIQDCPYLKWIAVKGDLPYAQEYLLTVRLRSYTLTSDGERYIVGASDQWSIMVTLWDSYPYVAPYIRMLSLPPVFHPDWYSKGSYCPSVPWDPETSLKEHILRMLSTIAYDPALMSAESPANYKALEWFEKNRDNEALFPSDKTALTENTPEKVAAIEKAAAEFYEIDSWQIRR